jgi:diguanylate cyclase (GGDEF)-like protein
MRICLAAMQIDGQTLEHMFAKFIKHINDNENSLMGKVLDYALKRGYTKYTSTLQEAWRLSISGLSKSLIEIVQSRGEDIELGPDEDYTSDSATQFGIIEAQRHKERGVSLDMFLGLMKYYHQSYQDLIKESDFDISEKIRYQNLINRFFDRVEIGFCTTWAASEQDQLVNELQAINRQMTNEKNKYLTIFESLYMPVFIVDKTGKIENMNHVASNIFNANTVPGEKYYEDYKKDLFFTKEFPWVADVYEKFVKSSNTKTSCEKFIADQEQYFYISCSRSLDVSGKFSGTIVIIEDITNYKKMEKELEKLATTDPLTGAKNRRSFLQLFRQELARYQRYGYQLALLMMDIDHFKEINDSYGHDTGDKVLKVLVAESHGILRGTDLFGRWGGEEFIILLPETSIHQASIVAERLRDNLAKIELSTDSDALIKFTVSIGLTIVNDKNALIDDLVKRADEALYLAKKQGRNRVVVL